MGDGLTAAPTAPTTPSPTGSPVIVTPEPSFSPTVLMCESLNKKSCKRKSQCKWHFRKRMCMTLPTSTSYPTQAPNFSEPPTPPGSHCTNKGYLGCKRDDACKWINKKCKPVKELCPDTVERLQRKIEKMEASLLLTVPGKE